MFNMFFNLIFYWNIIKFNMKLYEVKYKILLNTQFFNAVVLFFKYRTI